MSGKSRTPGKGWHFIQLAHLMCSYFHTPLSCDGGMSRMVLTSSGSRRIVCWIYCGQAQNGRRRTELGDWLAMNGCHDNILHIRSVGVQYMPMVCVREAERGIDTEKE